MMQSERITVIGCGTMGHSIALNAAWAGLDVCMYGLTSEETEKGLADIAAKIEVLLKGELLNESDVAALMNRISTSFILEEAVLNASFIIEAIPESLPLKHELLKLLECICKEDVILASNTSGLAPSKIAEVLVHPERFIVLHFWNPAHLIPLVEVVSASYTHDSTKRRSVDLLHLMNKKPVVLKKEIAGFIGNRLQAALFREALYLLEQGVASREDIDVVTTFGIGRRLPVTGPFASADMGGLDVFAAISNYLFNDLSNARQVPDMLKALVDANKLGQKSRQGFYAWNDKFTASMNSKRELELMRFLKQDQDQT